MRIHSNSSQPQPLLPDQLDAFVLTQTLGLSYADTAAICGCPIGTVRSRVARARDELVTALRDLDRSCPQKLA